MIQITETQKSKVLDVMENPKMLQWMCDTYPFLILSKISKTTHGKLAIASYQKVNQ